MPQDALIQFVTTGAPGGDAYCFTTFPRLFLDMAASLSGFLPGTYSTFIAQQGEPDVSDQDKIWIQLDAAGFPTGRYFKYLGGWFTRHPRRQDGEAWQDERIWWVGTEADIKIFDGGNTDAVSTTTGPMWEIDHDFDFRFPLGAGTSPKPTTVAVGDTGGNEEETLSLSKIPPHTHSLNDSSATNKFGRYDENDGNENPWGSGNQGSFEGEFSFSTQSTGGNSTGGTDPVSNMPPYRVGFWLKPTIRIYLRP